MKAKKRKHKIPRRYGRFSLQIFPVILYGLFWMGSLILAQYVPLSITAVLFSFLTLLPVLDLVLLFVGAHFLYVEFDTAGRTFTRGSHGEEAYAITLRFINRGPIPIARCRVILQIPLRYMLSSGTTEKNLMLPPFSVGIVKVASVFDSRGVFDVGIDEVYVSDYLNLFRLRQNIELFSKIKVLPQILSPYGVFVGLDGSSNTKRSVVHNHIDNGDIREYRAGDAIKSIHWKLSAKTEELQIRESSASTGRRVVIVCDLSENPGAEFDFPPYIGISSDDGVAEESLAAAIEAVHLDASGVLLLADGEDIKQKYFSDFKSAQNLSDALCEAKGRISQNAFFRFMETVTEIEDTTVLFVTAFLSSDCEERLKRAARSALGSSFQLCLCSCKSYLPEDQWSAYEAKMGEVCQKLIAQGIRVTVPRRKEDPS